MYSSTLVITIMLRPLKGRGLVMPWGRRGAWGGGREQRATSSERRLEKMTTKWRTTRGLARASPVGRLVTEATEIGTRPGGDGEGDDEKKKLKESEAKKKGEKKENNVAVLSQS